MAIVLRQSITAVFYSGSSTVAATFAALNNPSLLVSTITQENTAGTVTVSDGTSYTQDSKGSGANSGGGLGGGTVAIFSRQNTGTGTPTVTATLGGSSIGYLKIRELTGAATSAALDAQNTGSNNAGGAISVALTAAANSAGIAAFTFFSDGAADTSPSAWASGYGPSGGNLSDHFDEHNMDLGTAGSKTVTGNSATPSDAWVCAFATYKVAGAAADTLMAQACL